MNLDDSEGTGFDSEWDPELDYPESEDIVSVKGLQYKPNKKGQGNSRHQCDKCSFTGKEENIIERHKKETHDKPSVWYCLACNT
jgi:hypothetical protein